MKNSKSRRSFIKKSIAAGFAIPFLGASLLSCKPEKKDKKLKILILGGTSFLGPHQIAYALKRGHSVTTFTRGKTIPTIHKSLFTKVEQLVGDRENNLSALEKGNWDVVIDNSGKKVAWTKATANLLKDRVQNYLYTSSTGVYYPYLTNTISEYTELATRMPDLVKNEEIKMEYNYGVMKTNSEAETIKAFGKKRAIIVRPTYMFGPGDKTDRFIYWPIRLPKGGDLLIPGKSKDPVQYIDVRDVAEFMIRLAEQQQVGVFNAAGPKEAQTMLGFATEAQKVFPVKSNLIQVNDYNFLKENKIYYLIPWILPEGNNYGSARITNTKAVTAGLTFRNIQQSIKDTHNWWYSDALTQNQRDRYEKKSNGFLAKEKELLLKWKTYKK